MLKALGNCGRRELYEICNEIYIEGEWPKEFLELVIILIEKKQGASAKECVDFRTILY